MICFAVGLSPLTEILRLVACQEVYVPELGGWIPLHNANMETAVKGIYVAGDVSGVEEASSALDKGRIAGVAIAESLEYISSKNASQEINEIRMRLDELRSGPFGIARTEGNKKVYEAMRRWNNELRN